MRKVINFVTENKKIIIAVILLVVLIAAVYFINQSKKGPASATSNVNKTTTEVKLASILNSIDGVGATDVMINENQGEISGVVIVCEGADNIMTRNNILNAVSTALNIDKKIIAIYSMNI